MSKFRIEHDSMGELQVPIDALYGAQTQRAIDNFPISGLHLPREFIRALGLIKAAAADVNLSLGYLKKTRPARSEKPRWRWPMANTTHSFRSISSRPARAPAPT
jgi:fumarate hydratase class II